MPKSHKPLKFHCLAVSMFNSNFVIFVICYVAISEQYRKTFYVPVSVAKEFP